MNQTLNNRLDSLQKVETGARVGHKQRPARQTVWGGLHIMVAHSPQFDVNLISLSLSSKKSFHAGKFFWICVRFKCIIIRNNSAKGMALEHTSICVIKLEPKYICMQVLNPARVFEPDSRSQFAKRNTDQWSVGFYNYGRMLMRFQAVFFFLKFKQFPIALVRS